MVQLPREYKSAFGKWLPILIGCIFATVGFFALCFGMGALLLGAELQTKLLPLGGGALFLCFGIGFAIYTHWNFTAHTITCTPAGFSVTRENKRSGASREEYRWDEVTATNYEEIVRRRRKGKHTYPYFSVETARGRAFRVDHNQNPFDELITVFNEQTPRLPYIWARDSSYVNSVFRAIAGKPWYSRVPRASGTVPPPLPPPLPERI